MKYLISAHLLLIMSLSALQGFKDLSPQNNEIQPVVIELFTSEGCSGCPPADNLLSEYAGKSDNIIALSFHVHYWDRLGWSDPYSHQTHTDRQRTYAKKFNIKKVFTPQMIVNGTYSFVGSDQEEADKAITSARAEPMSTTVSISEVAVEGNYCQFKYRLSASARNTRVNFALTEDGLSQQVLRGENRGKLLKHNNVVRAFKTLDAPRKSDEVFLRLPDNGDVTKMKVVVYVQQIEGLKIIGAGSKRVLQP